MKNWRLRYDTDDYIYRVGGRWVSTEKDVKKLLDLIRGER